MRWFTSDTHFGHANIIRYCNRPFGGVHHMNEVLIDNWNKVVAEDDLVFHLGDVALGPWTEWDGILTRLNGVKFLVVGNHDRVFKGMDKKQNDKFDEHYNRWFEERFDNLTGMQLVDGTVVNLSHFPYDGDHTDEERYKEYRLKDDGTPLIHGHTHLDKIFSHSKKGTKQIHVGQDAWGFTPVSEEQVLTAIHRLDVEV